MDGGSTTDFTALNLLILPEQPQPQEGQVLCGVTIVRVVAISDLLPGGVRLASCIVERR
jgi:hypothetical protein